MAVVVPFIGAAIGSAVGGAFLGVAAASWGWLAGSLLSSVLFKPPAQQGPRLQDLTITGTDYGQTIPWVAGSPRLAPTYVWVSQLREIANTQKVGKGGGQKVTQYTYECDVMLRLTENITDGVARDWVNSELVRNGLTLKDGLWSGITVYTGEIDQLPDPTYEAAVGVGNAPAYRGGTNIVITGLQLGNGKQLPNFEHQITKSNITIDDRIRLLANFPEGSTEDQSLYEIGPGTQTNGTAGPGTFTANYTASLTNFLLYQDAGLRATSDSGNAPVTYEFIITVPTNTADTTIELFRFQKGATGNPFVCFMEGGSGGGNSRIFFWEQGPGQGINSLIAYQDTVDMRTSPQTHVAITVYSDNTASVWLRGTRVKNLVGFSAFTASAPGTVRIGGQVVSSKNAVVEYEGIRVSRAEVYTGASFTPPTTLTGDLTNVNAVVTQGTVPMKDLIEGTMLRAGYETSEFEVDPALGSVECHGYATTSVTATRAHLETLRPFGLYECNCSDKIYIFPRATTPAGSIPWEDLGASESPGDPSDPFPLQVGNEIEVPAQIAVRYRNVSANWNIGTEFSDRLVSSRDQAPQVVEMGFGMTPAQAKKVADTMLKDAMAGLGRATLRVGGRKHAKYEPGDILTTTAPNGTAYRFRIITKRDFIFMLEWDVALDDASALESPAITYEGYIDTSNPLRVAPTSWEVMSIRPLRDADASVPGPYVAITPSKTDATDEWPGGVFVRARLPEAYEQQFISGDQCVMGTCLTTLGDFSGGSGQVQRTGKLRVRVYGELASADYYDFFTDRTINAAVVGNEPIRFMTAEFIENDGVFKVYDLYNFLRGQLGMEDQIAGHASSERFVLLNNSVRRMVNETTDIDAEQQVKAATLNLLLDSVTEEDFTDDGIALRPLSPVRLLAVNDSGDLDFTWIRRSRLVARWTSTGVIAPLGEATESYRVKVYDDPDADPVRTVDVTTQAWTYTAANQASDGFTSGDPITVTVQQLSELVGEGDAATLETEAP
jgi:hypothetical protein